MSFEREISRFPHPPQLGATLIDELTNLCFYEQKIGPVDLLFVFGSSILQDKLGALIDEIIDKTQVATVLITGGVAQYNDLVLGSIAESECILSAVRHKNRKNLRFILETTSTNTLENVLEAQKVYNLCSSQRILFVAHSYAMMRSYLTLRRVHPWGEITGFPFEIPSGIDEYPINKANWFKTTKGKALVWGEYLRFEKYGRRGDFPIYPVEHTLRKIRLLVS